MDDKALDNLYKNMPFSSVPQRLDNGWYSVRQNNSGTEITGSLECVVEEFCGACASYPYTLGGQVRDNFWPHVHLFEDLLKVVLDNPTTFALTEEMREYYSKQQLFIIETFQKALLKERAQKQSDVANRNAEVTGLGHLDNEEEG